jgi:DNA polymerase III epsilon subunit-like protein
MKLIWTNSESENKLVMADLPLSTIAKRTGHSENGVRNRRYQLRKFMLKDIQPLQGFKEPRIGVFDVETLPIIMYAWRLGDQTYNPDQIIKPTSLLAWAGKYLNEPRVFSDILTPKEALARYELRIVRTMWDFLASCQIVIGHNITQFDTKHANRCFLQYGLPPIKYIQVDTLKIARENFLFDSNKMGFINKTLGIRQKLDNEGFPLWMKCADGNADALLRMAEYNVGDVQANEDQYFVVRAYVKNINMALYSESTERICPVCGSTDVKEDDFYYTPAGKWLSFRCNKCGCLCRCKQNELDAEKRQGLLVNS